MGLTYGWRNMKYIIERLSEMSSNKDIMKEPQRLYKMGEGASSLWNNELLLLTLTLNSLNILKLELTAAFLTSWYQITNISHEIQHLLNMCVHLLVCSYTLLCWHYTYVWNVYYIFLQQKPVWLDILSHSSHVKQGSTWLLKKISFHYI